jgi:hypothetical protein
MAIKASQIESEITLELDEAEITVGEFTNALDHFLGLVREVSKAVDRDSSRDWVLKVYPGSAGVGLSTKPGQSAAQLQAVRTAILDGLVALEDGIRPRIFSDKAIEHARAISRVFEKRHRPVSSVRVWSGSTKSMAVKKEIAVEAGKLLDPVFEDFGSVEGKLDVVSAHGKLECTIYDSLGDRAIKCDIREDLVSFAIEAFRRRVEVFGRVHYRQDGMAVKVIADRIVKFPEKHEIPSVDEMRGFLRN